jgi:2-dehydro-3-deoxyphosphogluconate aldolase/(4S)-4-hydroxy-2-oxoglutarate aldolase
MDREAVLQRIVDIGIIPVLRAERAEDALLVVDVLYESGIPVVEVTTTVPGAATVIAEISRKFGSKLLVGAGTVLNIEQAQLCIEAGASFLVSPGLSLPVLRHAKNIKMLAIPGVLSPTEVMTALSEGETLMKVFPCGSVGGPAYLKALRGPFPNAAFIPTGGVSVKNIGDYFAAGAIAVGVGGDLVSIEALRSGNLEPIRSAAQAVRDAVFKARKQS